MKKKYYLDEEIYKNIKERLLSELEIKDNKLVEREKHVDNRESNKG